MIKPKFCFLQIIIKFLFGYAIKLGQPALGEAPKRFNPINMSVAAPEFIVAMVDTIMLVVPNIYQSIIAPPSIAVNTAVETYFTAYDGLKCLFSRIRDNLSIDFPFSFENTKNNRFATGSTTSFARNSLGAKVRFIDLNRSFKWPGLLTPVSNFGAQFIKDSGYRSKRNTTQLCGFGSGQIHRKTLH